MYQETGQDSIKYKIVLAPDSAAAGKDSLSSVNLIQPGDSGHVRLRKSTSEPLVKITDTTSVCKRSPVIDITFWDSADVVKLRDIVHKDNFPSLFTGLNRKKAAEERALVEKHLREGSEFSAYSLQDDWLVFVVLLIPFLFTFIRTSPQGHLQNVSRFFLFRGINDPTSRDLGGLFSLESTIKNLISFLVTGLFIFSASHYYRLIPGSVNGLLFWLISAGLVMVIVTLRHIVCLAAGAISSEEHVFAEYIIAIYQFYRLSALFLFGITVLMFYTSFIPMKTLFTTGIVVLLLFYLFRIIRLFFIFLKRGISLFYLILYLCTLEFLPVLIAAKYISGLV